MNTPTANGRFPRPLFFLLLAALALLTARPAPAAAQPQAPAFAYETIFDAGDLDNGYRIAVDAAGNAFVAARANVDDVLVLKVAPDGAILWTTPLAGSGQDFAMDIAVDSQGNPVVVGWTGSADFPVHNARQNTLNGPNDAFIARLAGSNGAILFSTYFGGSRLERAHGLALDAADRIYIAGETDSVDFETERPIQAALNVYGCFCSDAFVSVFTPDAGQLLFSTYWGGTKDDAGRGIGLDGSGGVILAGETESLDFPLQNPLQAAYADESDAFVSRFTQAPQPDGSHVAYSTYLGGSGYDWVRGFATDAAGHAYVAGSTRSADFPTTPNAYQPTFLGGIDACGSPPFVPRYNCEDLFVTKVAPDGSAWVYSTFAGGTLEDFGSDLAVDGSGRAYVVGHTTSMDFAGGSGTPRGLYVVRLTADGSALQGPLFISSSSPTVGHGIAVDAAARNVYVTAAKNVPADTYVARIQLLALR